MATTKVVEIQWSESGLQIVPKELPRQVDESDLVGPRWEHWRQRKLGRIWMAVMLTLNLEPTARAREALKLFRSEDYAVYRDRLDIAKTLAGWEFEMYEDHLLEGDSVGDKYVDLSEFCVFAKDAGWHGLDAMKSGLDVGSEAVVPFRQNLKNNYLVLMHEVLTLLPSYDATDPAANKDVVAGWLVAKGMRQPVDARTLGNYLSDMAEAGACPKFCVRGIA
jgi:hypothetical protein